MSLEIPEVFAIHGNYIKLLFNYLFPICVKVNLFMFTFHTTHYPFLKEITLAVCYAVRCGNNPTPGVGLLPHRKKWVAFSWTDFMRFLKELICFLTGTGAPPNKDHLKRKKTIIS